jgi:hypothetical protein
MEWRSDIVKAIPGCKAGTPAYNGKNVSALGINCNR